ncbi:MAG: 30S ribosomal protein S4 [Candidatus Bathyarchaeota archaeon]|nr:MAG: 30S ribosomal protein S4 [Candidatus Bathyarchaeota archaeon]
MGDPKKPRKKYETPKFPWQVDTLQMELRLIGEYGLRNKKELWRHRTMISKFREVARSLLGMPTGERKKREKELLDRLYRLGILAEDAELDDVLDLSIENILERRFQSLVFRKGFAKSMHQARQFIAHGHIGIDKRRVSSPGYLVLRDEEAKIGFAPASLLSESNHITRMSIASRAEKT